MGRTSSPATTFVPALGERDTVIQRVLFALARVAFGLKFARDGYRNLTALDDMVAYADGAGVPAPHLLVPAASALLLAGGVLLSLGLAPVLGVTAVALFLLGVTPELHDFWNESGEDRTDELDAFLRNSAFVGAAIAFWYGSRED